MNDRQQALYDTLLNNRGLNNVEISNLVDYSASAVGKYRKQWKLGQMPIDYQKRDSEIVDLSAYGFNTKEIAELYGLRPSGVKNILYLWKLRHPGHDSDDLWYKVICKPWRINGYQSTD